MMRLLIVFQTMVMTLTALTGCSIGSKEVHIVRIPEAAFPTIPELSGRCNEDLARVIKEYVIQIETLRRFYVQK